jgi:site-specific DNA-methyltransferase (adenine-specific)
MAYQIIQGDNRDILRTFPDNYFDSIVTDPPYGIDFLGKTWDANTGALETYQECLRVLKPGGHILAFSAARTYHHLAITLEQAGFEIRDQIMWIYSSGFPKSQDVGKSIDRSLGKKDPNYGSKKTAKQGNETVGDFSSGARCGKCNRTFNADIIKDCKEEPCGMRYTHQTEDGKIWAGWGTALKPAHEPIAMARKPLHKSNSIARNCQQWGVGALNIDAGRVPYTDPAEAAADAAWRAKWSKHNVAGPVFQDKDIAEVRKKQGKPSGGKGTAATHKNFSAENTDKEKTEFEPWEASQIGRFPSNVVGEILQADYQKYFYCPKVSRRERHVGFEQQPSTKQLLDSVGGYFCDTQGNAIEKTDDRVTMCYVPGKGVIFIHGLMEALKELGRNLDGNNHPTVKPVELMKYLIRLITPAGGHVLDPFNGSGSTGMAAVELGYDYTGCELDPTYVDIARKRIAAWYATTHPLEATGLWE